MVKDFLKNVAAAEKRWLEYSRDLDMQNQFEQNILVENLEFYQEVFGVKLTILFQKIENLKESQIFMQVRDYRIDKLNMEK